MVFKMVIQLHQRTKKEELSIIENCCFLLSEEKECLKKLLKYPSCQDKSMKTLIQRNILKDDFSINYALLKIGNPDEINKNNSIIAKEEERVNQIINQPIPLSEKLEFFHPSYPRKNSYDNKREHEIPFNKNPLPPKFIQLESGVLKIKSGQLFYKRHNATNDSALRQYIIHCSVLLKDEKDCLLAVLRNKQKIKDLCLETNFSPYIVKKKLTSLQKRAFIVKTDSISKKINVLLLMWLSIFNDPENSPYAPNYSKPILETPFGQYKSRSFYYVNRLDDFAKEKLSPIIKESDLGKKSSLFYRPYSNDSINITSLTLLTRLFSKYKDAYEDWNKRPKESGNARAAKRDLPLLKTAFQFFISPTKMAGTYFYDKLNAELNADILPAYLETQKPNGLDCSEIRKQICSSIDNNSFKFSMIKHLQDYYFYMDKKLVDANTHTNLKCKADLGTPDLKVQLALDRELCKVSDLYFRCIARTLSQKFYLALTPNETNVFAYILAGLVRLYV